MSAYTSSREELLGQYDSDKQNGLSSEQAAQLLEKYGENKLKAKKHKNFFMKFLDQMKDFMVIILLVAAVVSFIVALVEGSGEYIDSIIILAIVVLNGVLGVTQESKAEKSLDALQDMSAPTAKVLRDGRVEQIASLLVVPGDIVLLEAGDFIPADGRILESASLKCEESALTGESVPVDKDANAEIPEDAALGDRINMVYSGCSVTYGRATVLVTSTGMDTEMGKIAGLLNEDSQELTPLQLRLNQMGKYLGILVIGICVIIFALGFFQNHHPLESFMTAVALAVAAIPEGLTAVVTVVLAIGVQKMVKKNAIIRRLPAVETLGSASVICSDKTGTLTQNRMTVQKVWPAGRPVEEMSDSLTPEGLHVIRLGALCNDGKVDNVDGEEKHIGDPTETALVAAAMKNGLIKSEMDVEYSRVAEIPFDSDRKLMTTVHKIGNRLISITKGGFDVLLPLCIAGDRRNVEEINLSMAENALRVLAVAFRELDSLPEEITSEALERDLTFVGLIGMIDPPREESRLAVAECKKAGIKTVMITGDHVVTASAIAKQLGILEEGDRAITGRELADMDDEQLTANIEQIRVYARVSPEDKIRIVKAWQARGDVVAMTGDGVNDAPALKAADIGCAMGVTGTDVAKGAADMVLTDDNFSTIVEAVKSGRGIYDNITKTIQFLLGSNLGEVFTVFFAMIFGWGSPLLPIHLLLVNIVTDALPALALGVEPVEKDVMSRKPIPKNQGVFADGRGLLIGLSGLMVGAITLAAYYLGRFVGIGSVLAPSPEVGTTMAFLVLALSQLVQAANCRSRKSLFKIGILSNPSMLKAFLGSVAVVLAICLIPPLEAIFRVVNLSLTHWLVVVGLALSPLLFFEVGKLIASLIEKSKAK
ncbi:MAG: cation-translocating P-type ATPase [Oscillospiraceae bacterium]